MSLVRGLQSGSRWGDIGIHALFMLVAWTLATDAFAGVEVPQLGEPPVRSLASDDLGGDDVIMDTYTVITEHAVDIDSQGRIFAAMRAETDYGGAVLEFYRSSDAGDSWQSWGTISDVPGLSSIGSALSIHVAEGAEDQFFVAYTIFHVPQSLWEVIVVRGNLDSPSLVLVSAYSTTTTVPTALDLSSDEAYFSDYYLYLAMELTDSETSDIWFARSIDYGHSWGSAYPIEPGSPGEDNATPNVCYSPGGYVHVAWTYQCESECDYAIRYRRATSFANAGPSSWGGVYSLTSSSDGLHQLYPSITAGPGNSLLMAYMVMDLFSPTYYPAVARYSWDSGTTWSPADMATLGRPGMLPNAHWLETPSQWCVTSFDPYTALYGCEKASSSDPLTWSGPLILSDRSYPTPLLYSNASEVDPSRDELAMVWSMPDIEESLDGLFFDAEWRGGPGYPNLEDGFPVPLFDQGYTDPAVIDLGGSPALEIVFGDTGGHIQAVQHDGEPFPGWPVTLGDVPQMIAVGDLNGDGAVEVVASTGGRVFAFAADGTLMPGWPVDYSGYGRGDVSIGALGPPYERYVLAPHQNVLHVLNYRGEEVQRYDLETDLVAPASIGDVNDDGITEFVTLQEQRLRVFSLASTTPLWSFYHAQAQFSEGAALGDLDLDGDLEIVTVGMAGRVMVFHHDFTPFGPGWPFIVSPESQMNAPALANVLGGSEPEILAAAKYANVYLLLQDGSVQSGYPRVAGDPELLPSSPIFGRVDRYPANVVASGYDLLAYSWDNFGIDAPGWPKLMDTRIPVSPACGDIDLDGRNEFVFVGTTQLTVVDVNYPPTSEPYRNWPMWGHDPQRTNCLNCPEDLATGLPAADGSNRITFRVGSSNPSSSSFVFDYELPHPAAVGLSVYDVRGRRLRRLMKAEQGAGKHRIQWDGTDDRGLRVAAGSYFARLQVKGGGTLVRKVTLLR